MMTQPTLFDIDIDFGAGLPRQRGHAAPPGTGPEGENCRICRFYVSMRYHGTPHPKCKMSIHRWTHGVGSDIRAKDPACRCWEKKEQETSNERRPDRLR